MLFVYSEMSSTDLRFARAVVELDFFGCMKLINYIRTETKGRQSMPEFQSKDAFEDDKYLQPALEDDALLFSVDELLEICQSGASQTSEGKQAESGKGKQYTESARVAELEEQLQRLQSQFADYRATVEKTLDERWSDKDTSNTIREDFSASALGSRAPLSAPEKKKQAELRDDDTHYFDSYAYSGTTRSIAI